MPFSRLVGALSLLTAIALAGCGGSTHSLPPMTPLSAPGAHAGYSAFAGHCMNCTSYRLLYPLHSSLAGSEIVLGPQGGIHACNGVPANSAMQFSTTTTLTATVSAASVAVGCTVWSTIGNPAGFFYVVAVAQADWSSLTIVPATVITGPGGIVNSYLTIPAGATTLNAGSYEFYIATGA